MYSTVTKAKAQFFYGTLICGLTVHGITLDITLENINKYTII